ncbi:nuclear transport factor 2 family protein [Actinoplanes sp. RD1]|uniref:nuclear transport factor 2 family protein n=1 Tax=Actinoplanes sp. RD1 TaxID=3064538 RepID=UPI002740C0BB|nr:nuclear transport factor 2 family protein [Actinoplanes sp. RD1]
MTPREIYQRMHDHWLAGEPTFDPGLLADDVVLESPFGRAEPIAGRDAVLAYVTAGHASVPFHFVGHRTRALHETADPDTIIVEYELTAAMNDSGATASAPFIAVLTVRDGKIACWREYQHTALIARAMTGSLT